MSVNISHNELLGLWEGPVDNNSSSVINATFGMSLSGDFAIIGDSVRVNEPINNEILPRVSLIENVSETSSFYGIVVGGVKKGTYPDVLQLLVDMRNIDSDTLVAIDGEPVRVCTQGRCIARTSTFPNAINVGTPLTPNPIAGGITDKANSELVVATSGDIVVAKALQSVPLLTKFNVQYIVVDVQREGTLS